MKKSEGEEIWRKYKNLEPGAWSKRLRTYCIPYYYFPITRSLTKKMMRGYDEGSFEELSAELKTHIDFKKYITEDPNSLVKNDNFFMKLNTCSAKDSMNLDMNKKPLPFFNFNQGLKAILTSPTCLSSLEMLSSITKAALVITPFYSFPPTAEWRMFIKDNDVVGISQINYSKPFADMTEDLAKKNAGKMLSVYGEVRSLIQESSYTIDFICLPGMTAIVDLNVFEDSDPLLFSERESLDGRLLYIIKNEEK